MTPIILHKLQLSSTKSPEIPEIASQLASKPLIKYPIRLLVTETERTANFRSSKVRDLLERKPYHYFKKFTIGTSEVVADL